MLRGIPLLGDFLLLAFSLVFFFKISLSPHPDRLHKGAGNFEMDQLKVEKLYTNQHNSQSRIGQVPISSQNLES